MKRKFRFKALALALAVTIPTLVLAESSTEAAQKPFWGKDNVSLGITRYPDGHCEETYEVHQYYFWIDFGVVGVGTKNVPCP